MIKWIAIVEEVAIEIATVSRDFRGVFRVIGGN